MVQVSGLKGMAAQDIFELTWSPFCRSMVLRFLSGFTAGYEKRMSLCTQTLGAVLSLPPDAGAGD